MNPSLNKEAEGVGSNLLRGLALGGLIGAGGYGTARLLHYLMEKMKPSEPELEFPVVAKTAMDKGGAFNWNEPAWTQSAALGLGIPLGAWGSFELVRALMNSYERKQLAEEVRKKQEELSSRIGATSLKMAELEEAADNTADMIYWDLEKSAGFLEYMGMGPVEDFLAKGVNIHGLVSGGALGLSIPVTYLLLNKLFGREAAQPAPTTDIVLKAG